MKFIHLADLHIGKTVNAFSMLEDQEYALSQVLGFVEAHRPDAVVIAGDVYDKAAPAADAVQAFDRFLTALAALGPAVMVISGNHDSPERLGFASGIIMDRNVYLYGVFDGSMHMVTLRDEFGEVRFHMLPFIRPADVRRFTASYGDKDNAVGAVGTVGTVGTVGADCAVGADNTNNADDDNGAVGAAGADNAFGAVGGRGLIEADRIESYQDAVAAVIASAHIDVSVRNVLIAHQFVASGGSDPERSDSERETIGGIDRIDAVASGMAGLFDYVALGHLHGPQRVGIGASGGGLGNGGSGDGISDSIDGNSGGHGNSDSGDANSGGACGRGGELSGAGAGHVRYAGSPLKYSFSECNHKKAALLVELRAKGELAITPLPIKPLHDMRRIRGPMAALIGDGARSNDSAGDYLQVILTDDEEIHDAIGKLRAVYPNVMQLGYDNARTNAEQELSGAFACNIENMDPVSLFEDFFKSQNGADLNAEQRKAVARCLDTETADSLNRFDGAGGSGGANSPSSPSGPGGSSSPGSPSGPGGNSPGNSSGPGGANSPGDLDGPEGGDRV